MVAATEEWITTRDGRQLFAERAGSGTPAVVFESGMGSSRNMWGAVVPLVAERTATLVYDRSGLGRSAVDGQPRTLERLATDLVDVIGRAADGPVVLVGHSWGGPIVRAAAAKLPERVAGLVLVDQTDEGCELFFATGNERQSKWMARVGPAAARLGLIKMGVKKLAAQLPEPAASRMRAEDGTVTATRTMGRELAGHVDDLRRIRDTPLVLPEVPVTLISGMVTTRIERGRRPEVIAAHRASAAALPQGRHVEATASSHYVPFTEPELVAAEIFRILDAQGA
jgi:pimeloyl-ACP methyl ester carboxylesterase